MRTFRISRRVLITLVVFAAMLFAGGTRPRNPDMGCLEGTVLGHASEPVAAATVRARNVMTAMVLSTTTDLDGDYRFEELPQGRYSLWVTSPSGASLWIREVIVVRGECTRYDVRLGRDH